MDGKFRFGIEQAGREVEDGGYLSSFRFECFENVCFAINKKGLNEFGTHIPREPSYLILNTAISTSWGLGNRCIPDDCVMP